MLVLDIGGEARYADAWNLNPSMVRTMGYRRGQPIARHIIGRAEAIPLRDQAVDIVIVERAPLSVAALAEIARIIKPKGIIVLRHAPMPTRDRHAIAIKFLPGVVRRRLISLDGQQVQETSFQYDDPSSAHYRRF